MIDLSNGVKVRWAVIVFGVVLLVGYFALRWWTGHGNSMPVNSWITVVVLLMIAGALLVAGWEIRRYLKGSAGLPPSPQRARATLVAAQASCLAGAVFTGWYVAHVLVDVRRVAQGADSAHLILALASAIACAAVTVSGFVVQAWCRIPPEDENGKRDDDGYPAIPA